MNLLGKVFVETLFALMPLLAEKRMEQKRRGRQRRLEHDCRPCGGISIDLPYRQ